MGKSRKDYEKYLNSISPDRDDERWIIGGKNRYCGRENYGTMINGHNLIYVIKYGICRYAYRICIDSYPGYVVKDPITLIEWVQGLKPGTVIKIRGIFIYHFL